MRQLCKLGKPDLAIAYIKLGVNTLQEHISHNPERCTGILCSDSTNAI